MKTVAIIGFYGPTLHHVAHTQADEIWVANHGDMVMGLAGDIPRCTRLFEIHKQEWFRRKELPRFEEYWNYLREEHDFPIYLQDPIPEIPSGVLYPFDEVVADIFPHLLRHYTDGREERDTLLTSSAAFMLALAIHEGFERVELYGIGMETETEYGYQLPGFTYMIGVANGRGIDVVNMEETPVCKAEVYAYSAIPYATIGRLRELRELYQQEAVQCAEQSHEIIAAFNQNPSGEGQNKAQAASDLASAYSGAVSMLDMLIEQDSQYLSRQALEVKRRTFETDSELFKAETNQYAGQFIDLIKADRKEEATATWRKYLHARASMHANSGAVQLLNNLIDECDLLKPAHKIKLTIKDQ